MRMMLDSNYTDLVDAARDAGLDVFEKKDLGGFANIHVALVCRDGWQVGTITSVPQSMGKATMVMDLHQNKMASFVGLFEALQTRERRCL